MPQSYTDILLFTGCRKHGSELQKSLCRIPTTLVLLLSFAQHTCLVMTALPVFLFAPWLWWFCFCSLGLLCSLWKLPLPMAFSQMVESQSFSLLWDKRLANGVSVLWQGEKRKSVLEFHINSHLPGLMVLSPSVYLQLCLETNKPEWHLGLSPDSLELIPVFYSGRIAFCSEILVKN